MQVKQCVPYQLVLMAKDQGSPISYETLRFLTVLVEDQNDNRPMFPIDSLPQSYRFSIPENTAKHTLIGRQKIISFVTLLYFKFQDKISFD